MIDIKRAVTDNRQVVFTHYFEGCLWYRTEFDEAFSVPVTDIGEATFNATEKALLLMRYMRKHNKQLEGA